MSEDSRNVYQRINAVKKGLRNAKLKKSGKNKFSNYEYMELTDFEDTLEDLCDKEGINTLFRWYKDSVFLVITNVTNPKDVLEIPCPMAVCGIKGATEIQNLGGSMTYLRRYLFVSTFGISEHDALEEQSPQNKVAQEWPNQNTVQNQPAPQPKEQPSPEGTKAYFDLINFFGFNGGDREGEQSKKALADSKAWMEKNLGAVYLPKLLTAEHVEKIKAFVTGGPENFTSDPIV